jgi:trigger factor
LEQYLEYTGQDPGQLVESVREQAVPAVKADLALRAVADAEEIEPTEEDLEEEIERSAGQMGMKPAQLRRNLERADQMPAVRSEWRKSRALSWLLEHVEIVDPDGQPIDRALLEPPAAEEDASADSAVEGNSVDDNEVEEPAS